ncbi:hypothetical protein BX070DRAFT_236218 [Coemansia spiralis]|nr:hypothetical protein BX070DRAFT_236218 [Coemansia spiralis]
MSAEHRVSSADKQSRRRTVTSTIRQSLRTEWQALSAQRPSPDLPAERPGSKHRKHRWQKHARKDEDGQAARTLIELLRPSDHKTPRVDAGETRRRRLVWRLGRTPEHWLRRSAYPQSDPSAGQSALERRKKIDTTHRQARRLAEGRLVTRIEAASFLSNAQWDVDRALRHVQLVLCTRDGILYDVGPVQGVVNSGGTSCYIDAVFVALFGAQSSCDGLLYARDLGCPHANDLLAVCRLFVNFLRAGELIDTWLVEELRNALIACGWQAGGVARAQQDASELYLFLMDTLQMPYLPLEVRMVHGADYDAADCKVVTQRMLELAFPDAGSRPLLLQELLESYFFDNRVEQLERILSGGAKVRTNAWSFLSMYPFYTPQSETGRAAASEYPEDAPVILPLLLKRYAMDSRGKVQRVDRRVIIPMVLDVTNIISMGDRHIAVEGGDKPSEQHAEGAETARTQPSDADADADADAPPPYPAKIQYRLVLRAAVCHKGASASTGHYVSFSTRLRLARPAEIARQMTWQALPGEAALADTRQHLPATSIWSPSGTIGDERPAQMAKSMANLSGACGIARWPTFTPASTFLHKAQADDVEEVGGAKLARRHSWPLLAGRAGGAHEGALAARADGLLGGPETMLAYEAQIRGSAADWANYAMTMNLGGPDPGDSPSETMPPAYPQCSSAPMLGELLRFDDMDIANGRVQYFSTGEGGRRCMDELSRDGYLLFYALQRVEQPEHARDYGAENPSQAMAELSSALRKDEHDEHARRVVAALMRDSGAAGNFEDMAMRWQNIRVDKQASPVGPLVGEQTRRLSERTGRSMLAENGNQSKRPERSVQKEDAWNAGGSPAERGTKGGEQVPGVAAAEAVKAKESPHGRHGNASDQWCAIM